MELNELKEIGVLIILGMSGFMFGMAAYSISAFIHEQYERIKRRIK